MEIPPQQQKIYRQVKALLVEFGYAPAAIVPTASFVNDLGFDSLDVAELAMQMELLFDISISFEKVESDCGTVKSLVTMIYQLKGGEMKAIHQ